MDIHTNGLGARRAADRAVNKIFGDNIVEGPQRNIPEWLVPYVHMVGFEPAFIEIRPPEALPETPDVVVLPVAWRLFIHRVNLIADGRKVGEALRMDDVSLGVLAAFERQMARSRGG